MGKEDNEEEGKGEGKKREKRGGKRDPLYSCGKIIVVVTKHQKK